MSEPAASYDEFGLLHENAAEAGLEHHRAPPLRRDSVHVGDGREVSCVLWGDGEPEIVLVHGGGQNAHTWDTVALALARPLVAVDLPGHGRSSWRDDLAYDPVSLADDLAPAIEAFAPRASLVCGMSLGGMATIALARRHSHLVRRLVVVDVTPGVTAEKAAVVIDFLRGPEVFESFDEILERTVRYNPTRSESSLRRGILHNARELPGGQWTWRYDRRLPDPQDRPRSVVGVTWDDFAAVTVPTMLVRGALSPVVTDDDVAEARLRRPDARVEVVEGAGHSVQGDRPVELARLIEEHLQT